MRAIVRLPPSPQVPSSHPATRVATVPDGPATARCLPRLVIALTLAGALGLPQGAHAAPAAAGDEPAEPPENEVQGSPQLQQAMDAFRRGTSAYDEARYEDALAAFQDAATLYASPDFQYNIGLCYEKLNKPEEAIRAFKTYLRTKPEASDRANVEDRIARLRDDVERGESTPPVSAEPPPPTPVDSPPRDRSKPLMIAGGALAGVGAALALGGGIGFGVLAKRRSDDLDEIQDGGNPQGSTFPEAQDLEREGKRFEALQVTFAAVGAAVAITGAALLALGAKRRKQASTAARMHVVPGLGARSAGFSLVGRF